MKAILIQFIGVPVASLWILAGAAAGDTILVNTFGPADSYNIVPSWGIFGPDQPTFGESDVAVSFVSPSPMILSSADVAVRNLEGDNTIDVRVVADDDGLPSTTLLDEVQISVPPGTAGHVMHVEFSNNVFLHADVRYWLWLSAPNDAKNGWHENSEGHTGVTGSRDGGIRWNSSQHQSPAVRITAIPEPSQILLMLVALPALWVQRTSRIKRRPYTVVEDFAAEQ